MSTEPKKKDFMIKELKQEKLIYEEIINYLEENEVISKDIFDSFSHELRTPIVSIKAYTDMLLQGHFGELSAVQKEKLERVKESTGLLIMAIFQLLEKSHKRK